MSEDFSGEIWPEVSVRLFLHLPFNTGNIFLANRGFVGLFVVLKFFFLIFFPLSFPPFSFWLFDIGSCYEAQVHLTLLPTENWDSNHASLGLP